MKSSIIAAICVMIFCISGTVNNAAAAEIQCEEEILYEANLKTGYISNPKHRDGFTFIELLRPDAKLANGECNLQGVLKITFPEADSGVQERMLRLDLEFDTPFVSGHAVHLGDSLTNRAMGGDDGGNAIPYIGEAFSSDLTWTVHTNDLPGHGTIAANSQEPYVVIREPNYITNHVKLIIGDEFIRSDNYQSGGFVPFQSKYLPAALRGQGQDYNIAVGMNRLINGEDIDGTGLCRITITACDAPRGDQTPIQF